jgi:hypothetical protein
MEENLFDQPWPWEMRMIGSNVAVVGTVRRSCKGIGRDSEVRVMGAMEVMGVTVVAGILPGWPMSACSIRAGNVDCIVNRLLVC